jgi:NADH:ubiquinone oxidoreductase subunit 5 (subunit L)/multisubunit Na+/H+ antiporter MnhA subunit
LVHSSTLVVAGVYILLQFSYCLVDVLDYLKYFSLLTLVLRTIGLVLELDIKKLIAYSTLSHVSLMMYILRIKLFKVVYFHLNIHAIFKSTILICFGFVILISFHAQDKRLVRFVNLNPLLKIAYYYSRFCLIGLPFLRGFFSKDFMIEKIMEFNSELFSVILLLLFLGVRGFYGIKLLNLAWVVFPQVIVEKSYLGVFRVLGMILVMTIVTNLYVSLMLRLTLEFLSFKIIIYFFMLVFLVLRFLIQTHIKFLVFDKIKSFKEF